MIIDFHTHTFPDKVAPQIIGKLSASGNIKNYTDSSSDGLCQSMKKAGIDWSVNLPICTRPDQVEKINRGLIQRQEEFDRKHIITFGGIHPDYPDIRKELLFLKEHHIPGIKLHPAFQNYDLDSPKMISVIAIADELGMIVLTHGGADVSFPWHNFASIPMILNVINEVHPTKLVIAHMGGWHGWKEVLQDLAGAPVWFDTAFSLGSVYSRHGESQKSVLKARNLSQEKFLKLARKHGTDRILFGTDSPWADQSSYMDYFSSIPLTPKEREQIMGKNAEKLLKM